MSRQEDGFPVDGCTGLSHGLRPPYDADVSMKSRTVFSRDVDSLSCEIVGLLQPGDQLFINVVDAVHANAMGEQRIEACSGFESLSCDGHP